MSDLSMIGALTISRDSHNEINVTITDRASGIRFVELKMTPADFAIALTGQAYIDGEMRFRGLENVGKELVIEKREITAPLSTYDKEELRAWLVENAQEEGWILDSYLGSHGSVHRSGEATILRYSVRKYIARATGGEA